MISPKQATQVRKEKMLRDILVIKTDIVYKDFQFEGFASIEEINLEPIILEHYEYQQRGKMEIDPSYQQAIPYVLIVNPEIEKVIAYQRGDVNSIAGDKRLFGKWSLWVGGHIEVNEQHAENPLLATAIKEIEEEINLTDIHNIHILGYINDNSSPVSKVHLGIVYIAETEAIELSIGDGELEQVFLKSYDEIEEIMTSPDCDVEEWSVIAWNAYKKHKEQKKS